MKSTRMPTTAAIALGAALALTGCAADAAGTDADAARAVNACTEVRNVTNGALNTLAGDFSADADAAADYFTGLVERIDALAGTVDNAAADGALADFSAALGQAGAYVAAASGAAIPAEGAAEPDAALVRAMTTVQSAASEAAASCSAP